MLLNPIKYHAPKTPQEAIALFSSLENVRFLAGGTFLLNNLKTLKRRGLKTPENIISLKKVDTLKGIEISADQLIIRPMTVINDVFFADGLNDNFAILKTVCRNISTNPIRNMATVGGNLTSRYTWTELGAVLIALEAEMEFLSADGKTETIPVEDFFANKAKTDKLLTAVIIQRRKEFQLAYQRVQKMSDVDIPMLAVCIRTVFKKDTFSDTRVVINNTTTFASRDKVLENFLNGQKADPKLAEEALRHLDVPIYDTRSSDYKKHMFRVSIKRALHDLIERSPK